MAEDEIEIQLGDVKVNPGAITPSPTGQLLELGTDVLPSLKVSAGEALSNLATNVVVPGVDTLTPSKIGSSSQVSDSDIVPESIVSGGQGSVVNESGVVPDSEIPIGQSGQSSALTSGSTFSRGLQVSEGQPSPGSSVSGEPTLSQIEKVYDATNTCRSSAEIVKITGLPVPIVTSCIAWLTKKGWIVDDDNKRLCSVEAMSKFKVKFDKLCSLCK